MSLFDLVGLNHYATMQFSYCGLPAFVPAAHFLKKEKHMIILTSGQKVITERKDAAWPEAFFESLLPHLKTGTIRMKKGEL